LSTQLVCCRKFNEATVVKASSLGFLTALLVSASVYAADATDQASVSSLPTFAQSKPAVDGVNGKLGVYGGAAQNNSLTVSSFPGLGPLVTNNNAWNGIGGEPAQLQCLSAIHSAHR
ncbi:MAG: hypothetical protein ACKOEW_01070, partial [Methylocystis sp.]